MDLEKTFRGTDLIANAFRGSIQNTRLFSIFSLFIFCSITYLFEKQNGDNCCLPSKDSFIIHYLYSKDGFTYGPSVQSKCFLFVYMYIDLFTHTSYGNIGLYQFCGK